MSKSSFAERNKAIREAWNKELELVQEGRGTRNWTPDQQKDILEKGRAYDDSGRAFEGQHMKSAEKYPEYQGESGNIQFLTRAEHLEAHDGNWKNPTNWYFNPETKEKINFGDGRYVPCEIIDLTDVVQVTGQVLQHEKDIVEKQSYEKEPYVGVNKYSKPSKKKKVIDWLVVSGAKAAKFSNNHPIISTGAKMVIGAALEIGTQKVIGSARKHRSISPKSDIKIDATPGKSNVAKVIEKAVENATEHSSPVEHIVPGHGQHYHTKDGLIWKDKASYKRGGK